MKKILSGIIGCLCAGISFAQLPVSTSPQNRKAVLEELTGIYCYWCPAGHKIANNLKASRPAGSVVLVNCHCTGLSSPSFNDPNYRTPDGDSLAEMPGMSVTGIPAGAINRHLWPAQSTIPMNRTYWATYADAVLAQPSYVNMALEGSLNVATRVLTVNVQVYYTGNSPASTNKLTVVLLEDTVIGKQAGGFDNYPEQTNPDGSYRHHHMLRKMLTAPFSGEIIGPTTSGTLISRTYTFTVPDHFKNTPSFMGNLRLAGFIAESNLETITGANGPITLTGFAYIRDAAVSSIVAEQEVCAGRLHPEISLYNNGSAAITTASIAYRVNGGTAATYNYTGFIAPATAKHFALPEISFPPGSMNTLSATVTGVNGSTDQNSSNDSGRQDSIFITSHIATDTNMRMEYTQINTFNGSSWKLYDEVSNTVVAEDGPFLDVSYMSTEVRVKEFKVKRNTCYRLVLENSEYARDYNKIIGNYTLYAGGMPLIIAPETPSGKASAWFKSGSHGLGTGNEKLMIHDFTLSPNPATDVVNLRFTLGASMPVSINVYDAVGTVVLSLPARKLLDGVQSIPLPVAHLAAGLYMVRIHTEQGKAYARFQVLP